MTRVAAVVAIAILAASSACHRATSAPSADRSRAAGKSMGRDAAPPGLPEDPAAGRESEIQWRAHLALEERERQLGYDRRKLAEHQAVVGLLATARARYDRAATEAAVANARARMPRLIKDLRGRITAIDHWGVNSPLVPEYEALIAALPDAYPDARIAALRGNARSLETLRADLDRRTRRIADWLRDAAASQDE